MKKFIVKEPYVICIMIDRKLNRKFKGIAKCNPPDVFDIQKGKQIAELKAGIKKEDYRINKADRIISQIERQAENLIDEYENRIDLYQEKLEEKYCKLFELTE